MKRIFGIIMALIFGLSSFNLVFAATDIPLVTGGSSAGSTSDGKFQIIPESQNSDSQVGDAVKSIGESKEGVWKTYNEKSKSLELGGQFSSGIMNWDTLLNYAVYLVKFLFQVGLFVGAIMIIYGGYMYSMHVFGMKQEGKTAIVHAIVGSLIVIFSYAIIKILTSMFL